MGEKRQRVDAGPTDMGIHDYDMAAILAQATTAATQAIEENMELVRDDSQSLDQEETKEEPPTLLLSDPHLSMRILSLPVLESLVRSTKAPAQL